ncbi:MAG: sensor histidine kinase [Devosiaceae bacterium]|nr:sensor histidine kinase [Devosiaceae bacterium]
MISGSVVIGTSIAYVILLFIVAYISDLRARQGRWKLLRSPLIYTLAISVYATSWTFYGAVGSAARNGLEFLAIYMGPTLVFVGWWFGLRKLVRIGHNQRITSIADFVSSRFGKSERLAILITIIAVIGITPYIALQLKAITTSLRVILATNPNVSIAQTGDDLGLAFAIAAAMALFSVLFGTRNINANEQHHGVVAAIAFEAVVKFVALVAVGLFVVFGIGGGFEATFARAQDVGISLNTPDSFGPRWLTITILSAAAIICLPRQFQTTVVENADENHLKTASWAFPLYLLGMSIFTLPIAIIGLSVLPAGSDPDMFVLALPLANDQNALALFAFIGGFSSATSMIIIASIALSIMISNHIVVPIALRSPNLFGLKEGQGMTRLLLTSRRASIAATLFLGFVYFWLTSGSGALAPIGLISFAGVAQFMPAILAALYWRDATANGALAGLLTGSAIWAYSSFLPSFATSNEQIAQLLLTGPWGIEFLRPQALLGLDSFDPLVQSVFWSLLANTIALVVVSIMGENNAIGRLQATLFVDVFKQNQNGQRGFARSSAPLNDLFAMTRRVLGTERAESLFDSFAPSGQSRLNIEPTPEFITRLEKELAGSIGAASAHVLLGQVVSGDTVTMEEVMQMADETQQILEYSQMLEETTTELRSTTDQLQQANVQLRQLDQQKDEFLSQVSHEVRTPMTAIRSFAEILLTNKDLKPTQRQQFVRTIHDESMRLTGLLEEILDLNALERGEKLWANEPVDPNRALNRAIEVCTPVTDQHQVSVQLGNLAKDVRVIANFDRICQVFINLISNAAKYNDAKNPSVTISSKVDGQHLLVDFIDNGPGISAADTQTIFDKFWRGTRNPDTSQSGSGLGLAISREILGKMDGSLNLITKKNPAGKNEKTGPNKSGACFRVTLPLHTK